MKVGAAAGYSVIWSGTFIGHYPPRADFDQYSMPNAAHGTPLQFSPYDEAEGNTTSA